MAKTSLTNNQEILKNIIRQEFEENTDNYKNENDFFEYFGANQILKKMNLSDDQIHEGITGGGNDGGCDAIYIFINGEAVTSDQLETLGERKGNTDIRTVIEIKIIQTKEQHSFGEAPIQRWKTVSENLLTIDSLNKYKNRYAENILDKFIFFNNLIKKFSRYKIKIRLSYYYVSLASGDIHPNVLQEKDELITKVKVLYPQSEVSVEFIDANKLITLYNTDEDYITTLNFSDHPISLQNNEYIALINLATYYDFITDENGALRSNIFEANVRDYQGKNSVNSSIAKTLLENSKEDFWWLNNGVTIISSELTPVTNKSLQIKNPEIVNGLQTSREIFNFFSNSSELLTSEKRNLLIRILKPENETSRDKVIFATNNQTSIPLYSLRVTDTIQLQIELYFKNKGLYYDRRKNYYKNQKKKMSDIIGVTFLAQCLITLILKKPDFARARPSTIITDDEMYKKLYKESNNLEAYYQIAKIGKYIKSIVMKSALPLTEKNDILFYVIYTVVAKRLNSTNITFENLESFNYKSLTDTEVNNSVKLVFEVYSEAGRNSIVVKSPDFINKVISKMDLKN